MRWNRPGQAGNSYEVLSLRLVTDSIGTCCLQASATVPAFCQESIFGAEEAMYSDRLLSIHRVTDTAGSTPCEKSLHPRTSGCALAVHDAIALPQDAERRTAP
jgi:hypothetical protein